MNGFGDNLWLKVVFFVRKHTHMRRKVAVDLHETQGGKAVEPCVGNLLHDLLISFIVNLGNQSLTLFLLSIGKNFTVDAVSCSINNIVLCNAVFHTFQ